MIWLLGDVHGNFSHILKTVERSGERPAAVIFLGDLDCQRPFSACVADIEAAGIQCWAIPGNHDTDSRENYLNLWGDPLFQERNLHGRIVEIDGLRVAGLGGIFRGNVWSGEGEPEIRNYAALVECQNLKRPTRLRVERPTVEQTAADGLLRKHQSTIFYDDWWDLIGQPADLLVTHEAPDCHPHGFQAIAALAQSMGVRHAFHGHHHEYRPYRGAGLDFQPVGVGFCGIVDQCGRHILAGEFDEE